MKRDDAFRITLHILAHLAEPNARPTTSEVLAAHFRTNPVVIRRALARLREAGIATSSKGHGGGWTLARPATAISSRVVYTALGERVALRPAPEVARCLMEQAVDDALARSYADAEAVLLRHLDEITLADIAADYRRRLADQATASNHAHPPDG